MVVVSRAPVVSGSSAPVAPRFVGRAVAAFPPAVHDLARFFLSLAGAVVGLAGTTVPASGEWVLLCPSAPGIGAVTGSTASSAPARTTGPPFSTTAVSGSFGRPQCEWEVSRSSRRRRRSSSGGIDRSRWRDMGRAFPFLSTLLVVE